MAAPLQGPQLVSSKYPSDLQKKPNDGPHPNGQQAPKDNQRQIIHTKYYLQFPYHQKSVPASLIGVGQTKKGNSITFICIFISLL